jgi:hypothetical protein
MPIVAQEDDMSLSTLTRLLLGAEFFTLTAAFCLDLWFPSSASKQLVSFNMIALPLTVANYYRAVKGDR